MKNKIAILGSTGSIGKSTINILKKDKNKFEVVLLTTHKNLNELYKQIKIFNVKNIIITDQKKFNIFKKKNKIKKLKIFNDYCQLHKIIKKNWTTQCVQFPV